MAIIAARMAGDGADLPTVRRFEAAGFRAWPAASVAYDGTWAVRLTPDMTARRLNSINPLDQGDAADIDARIAATGQRFQALGRAPTFRMTPLASPGLVAYLDRAGWEIVSPSLVMRAELGSMQFGRSDLVQPVAADEFAAAAVALDNLEAANAEGFVRLIDRIQPEIGIFHIAVDGRPAANAICVRDGNIAGLFEVATAPGMRGQGLGRKIVEVAFAWAKDRGASTAWLQVEASNGPALRLYRSLGFETIYPYHYRSEPKA